MKSKTHQIEKEYISRINKAIDYIENNLDQAITLNHLAEAANFSKFHFHRIFQAFIGETPFQFIQRIRLERAANLLLTNKSMSISEIAVKTGFTDISIFSRNFKNTFKISATQYRSEKIENSNLSKINSNIQPSVNAVSMYFCQRTKKIKWRTTMKLNKNVEVKELPQMTVAYIRHIGPYKGDEKLFETLWGKICTWAGAKGLMEQKNLQFLVVYHDDPNVTVEDKLRMSVCLTVPPETKVDGEIGKMEIEAAKYLVARFVVKGDEFMEAWQWVYGEWFPNSGYQPDDKPCFELYPEEPKDGVYTVDICVPVKPL